MRGPGVAVLSVPVNSPVSNKIFRLTSTKYLASLQFWTAEMKQQKTNMAMQRQNIIFDCTERKKRFDSF